MSDAVDASAIRRWLAVLDSISYYELFRIEVGATSDDLRSAFHAFAETFHPDVHHGRTPEERAAIGLIFKRGTEAYRVLSEAALRARYDEALVSGVVRPEAGAFNADERRPSSTVPAGGAGSARAGGPLVDKVRSPSARPFAMRAEELAQKGDLQQAKLQVLMAMHLDASNAALEAYAKELEETLRTKAEDAKKSWKK